MMENDDCLPYISTDLNFSSEYPNDPLYLEIIKKTLRKILPKKFFELYRTETDGHEELLEFLHSNLPLTSCAMVQKAPSNLSFYILSRYRSNAFKFFFELISRWLIPGKRLNVLLIYAVDFTMPELSADIYTLCEVVLRVESAEELEEIQRNLPIIESEACLGVVSSYYARRILEVKGLSSDEKTAMIQEHIAHITTRLPRDFSFDVFTEMQHVLVMCREDFKAVRDVQHLSRLICVQYLFRKSLRNSLRKAPDKRHLLLKIFNARLQLREGRKKILGIIVAVNFLRDKEVFEESHLVKAIRKYIPQAESVENSFVFNRRGTEPICTLYLEIQKDNNTDFSVEEIKLLRHELPSDLGGRIERLMHPVFMPRNEEEIMRNILTLSNQIKYLRDIPQMFITFDEQTHHHLFFTVIIVRVIKPDTVPVGRLFSNAGTAFEFIHDRCRTIGHIRKKYRKEANVFRVKVLKEQFLRHDHSIDLYKARQSVVNEITRLLGDVRDFNGGMISKQSELLASLVELLEGTKYNDLLLENFFYSLNPVIMRTVLDPQALKTLFQMLLDCIGEGLQSEENYALRIRAEPNFVYVMIGAVDRRVEDEILRALERLELSPTDLATSCVYHNDVPYFGYIFSSDDATKQRHFCIAVQHAVEACEQQMV